MLAGCSKRAWKQHEKNWSLKKMSKEVSLLLQPMEISFVLFSHVGHRFGGRLACLSFTGLPLCSYLVFARNLQVMWGETTYDTSWK